jgi:hypothetical protein
MIVEQERDGNLHNQGFSPYAPELSDSYIFARLQAILFALVDFGRAREK